MTFKLKVSIQLYYTFPGCSATSATSFYKENFFVIGNNFLN